MPSSRKRSKHILIVGGMGPQASVYAQSLIIKQAAVQGAVNNEDYPRITHISVNVRDFIDNPDHREEARDYLISCLKEINLDNVDVAFIACNTAHLIQDDLEAATGLRFISLIDTTIDAIQAQGQLQSVGIVSTPSTLATGLYRDRLTGISAVIEPSANSLHKTEGIIRSVISGGDERLLAKELQGEIDALIDQGAQKIILGCTELSLLGSYLDASLVVDPLSLTVSKVLE